MPNPVQEAIAKANAICQMALESTPEEYRRYIIFIPQSKRVGNQYVNIQIPYMETEGRLKMAQAFHLSQEKRFNIETVSTEILGKPMMKAIIDSEIFGTRTGSSEIKFGGKRVDETHPIENAETSAIGRALGFMGFGPFHGIIEAPEESEEQPRDIPNMSGQAQSTGQNDTPASPKQIDFFASLLAQTGCLKGTAHDLIDYMYPDGMSMHLASGWIEYLQDYLKSDPEEMEKEVYVKYLKMLREKSGLSRDDVLAYCDKSFKKSAKDLNEEERHQLFAYLVTVEGEKEESEAHAGIDMVAMVDQIASKTGYTHADIEPWVESVGGIEKVKAMALSDIEGKMNEWMKE